MNKKIFSLLIKYSPQIIVCTIITFFIIYTFSPGKIVIDTLVKYKTNLVSDESNFEQVEIIKTTVEAKIYRRVLGINKSVEPKYFFNLYIDGNNYTNKEYSNMTFGDTLALEFEIDSKDLSKGDHKVLIQVGDTNRIVAEKELEITLF